MGGLGVWQAFFAHSDQPVLLAADAQPIPMDVTTVVDASSIPVAVDAAPAPRPRPIDAGLAKPDARRRLSRVDAGRTTPVPIAKRDAAPTKTEPDPQVTGSGKVTILVAKGTPFANVKIDGRSIGPTPLIGHTLSAGPHVIVWTSPDTNAVRDRRAIVLKDGQRMTLRAK